jgi:hypothetical protein
MEPDAMPTIATIDRLVVIWRDPMQEARHPIGTLARAHGEIRFWYEQDLSAAFSKGFKLLLEFPEHRVEASPYLERYLFALFAERIPSQARPDARAMLASWGVERVDDQFEVLARSGGIRATDRIELAEYRSDDDELATPLEFRVASRRHLDDPAPLSIGDDVTLIREPTNDHDARATIIDRAGRRAGYVPRPYVPMFARLLDAGVEVDARVIRQLLVPDDVGKWVVRATRR